VMTMKTYTTVEVARQIGISRQTLQSWISRGRIQSPKAIKVGNVALRLWTKTDIQKARKFKGTLKPGPRAKKKER
jgi:excisionase family DNA binding protein